MTDTTEPQLTEWLAEQICAFDAGELSGDRAAWLDEHYPDWRSAWARLMTGAPITDEQTWEVLLDASRRYGAGELNDVEVDQVDTFFQTTNWRTPEAIAQAAVTK